MDRDNIETALLEQKAEFEERLKTDMCSRPEETLVDLNSKLAQVVIGVRRSGKSTLCFNVIKQSGLKFAYVNFDDERLVSSSNASIKCTVTLTISSWMSFRTLRNGICS